MESKDFIKLLEDAGLEPRSYSGRGMYGKECVGVSTGDVIKTIVDIARESLYLLEDGSDRDTQEVLDILEDSSTDQLGLNSILYWRDMEWIEES